MEFAAGDKVRYLNDVGGGTVVKTIDSQLVEIMDENGFEMPVLKSELVLIAPTKTSNKQAVNSAAVSVTVEKPETVEIKTPSAAHVIEGNDTPKLSFAFVPVDGNILADQFEIYLINDCNYHLLYTVHEKINYSLTLFDAGMVDANTKVLIGKAAKSDISKVNTYTVQGVYYKKKQTGSLAAIQEDVKFNPIKLSKPGSFKENEYFDHLAIVIPLGSATMEQVAEQISDEDIAALVTQEKQNRPRVVISKPKQADELREIDLHIHELVDDETGLTPGDILDIQVKRFKKEMEQAILDRVKKIVFIHGVGQGVLKMKIRTILDRDYRKYQYQDASFAKYKFGATLIEL